MMSPHARTNDDNATTTRLRRYMVFLLHKAVFAGGNLPPAPNAVNIVTAGCLGKLNQWRDYELAWRTSQGRPDRPGGDPGAAGGGPCYPKLHQPGGAQPEQPPPS